MALVAYSEEKHHLFRVTTPHHHSPDSLLVLTTDISPA
jgi:hypothetical protein